MSNELTNWSGSLRFTPKKIYEPKNELELGKIVNHAVANKQTVRPIGSFHSSSPIIEQLIFWFQWKNFKD